MPVLPSTSSYEQREPSSAIFMLENGAPNEGCPAFFSRPVHSARLPYRNLIGALRELHLRQELQRNCTGEVLATPSTIDVERHHNSRTGVTIEFISEVAKHIPSTMSVSDLVATILNPVSKVSYQKL